MQDDPDGFLRCLGAWSHVLDLVVSGHCGQHKVYETAVTTLSRNLVFNLRRSGGGSLSLSCGTDVEEVQSPDAAESHRKGSGMAMAVTTLRHHHTNMLLSVSLNRG